MRVEVENFLSKATSLTYQVCTAVSVDGAWSWRCISQKALSNRGQPLRKYGQSAGNRCPYLPGFYIGPDWR